MNRDWDRVLAETDDWTGRPWADLVCDSINKFTTGDGIFLTLGPGMVGTEAWVVSDRCPKMKILGFEPQTDRYNFLKDKFPGELTNAAVASHDGTVQGWMGHRDGKSDFWLNASPENQQHYLQQQVDTVTVDSILEPFPRTPVVLWMDIEGAELEALRGAILSLLSGQFWFISIELNFVAEDNSHCYWAHIVELLRRMGYIASASSSKCNVKTNEINEQYVSLVETTGHTDVLFTLRKGNFPRNYLSAHLVEYNGELENK